ncbi:MAG: metalloregulator ArsR/SmtB family transcription factor [Acidobacteria bacterium]|nr:metalloregulator ArsR/SmtB family transcription factor [Acidobacteriota bacterium]
MEDLFTALSDQTRLRLLNLIRDEEVCVCFFVEALDESQPKISRHLAYLRKTGLVATRRDGKWMHYKINLPEDEHLRDILNITLDRLALSPRMQEDYAKLVTACCAPDAPVTISRAPKPETLVTSSPNEAEEELETFLL